MKKYLITILFLYSVFAEANTDCIGTVALVEATNVSYYIQLQGQGLSLIGPITEIAARVMYSTATTALVANKNITVRYNGTTFDCNAYNSTVPAIAVIMKQ